MTQVLNRNNLPQAFLNFADANRHTKGGAEISITGLIDSPQIRHLTELHEEDLTVDVVSDVMAMFGTAVHNILEAHAPEGDIVEARLHTVLGGMKVSGQIDRISGGLVGGVHIQDWKTVQGSALTINPKGSNSWISQLNGYAVLARENDIEVDGLSVGAFVRDWSNAKARRSRDFPQAPYVEIPILMWDPSDAKTYFEDRVKLHQMNPPPPCTDEERWMRNPVFAVYEYKKTGGGLKKRATRLLDSTYEAEAYMMQNNITGEIIKRPSEPIRCEGNYCGVSSVCEQFKKEND